MPHSSEGKAFLDRLEACIPLDDALQPSLDDEIELRRLFATDKDHVRLQDPFVGLVDVFDGPNPNYIFATRARSGEDLSAKYVMPLKPEQRRTDGVPCIVDNLDTFRKNWAIFSEGSLSQLLDWNNVVAAGGSVLACLTPLPESATASKRATRKFYHNQAYPTSDVDLFLWGMTPEQAEAKIVKIFEAVRDSVPWDCTCVRTKHTISIHSQYPYRSVQIVLRLYSSVSEILTGFDIDAPCCAYDGQHVWANPRAIVAMMRQCNTVDMTRRSPSYEVRLAKYAARAFEVYVPSLSRSDIDPTIYERSIARIEGLARLLVFEKIKDTNDRDVFLQNRRMLRGRPNENRGYNFRRNRSLKGDLKNEEGKFGGLEMNDYDVASLHIPYGPGWDARRIEKLVYQTDLGMNSTFNPKNKGRRLHRHPAFFGTIEECMSDCCEYCPDAIDEDERKLLEEEDKNYIRGRISFIQEDPGRQSMTGSFNPIDVGEWSEQVYIGPTEKFFAAIAAGDRAAVNSMLDEETSSDDNAIKGVDINRRDHVGRTSLHLAIICRHAEVALDLVNRGARISARLVDGRSPLHLAAQYDMPDVVETLLATSAVNALSESLKSGDVDEAADHDELDRASSQDDWSSSDAGVISLDDEADDRVEEEDFDGEDEDEEEEDDGEGHAKAAPSPPEVASDSALDDADDTPDILDVNLTDWDLDFTPLAFAVIYARPALVSRLIAAGANISQVSKAKHYNAPSMHPLSLTILREDEDEACAVAGVLLKAGAVSSTADDKLRTVLHDAIAAKKLKLVKYFLDNDPKAVSVLNFPAINYNSTIFPLTTAIAGKDWAMSVLLVGYGAKIVYQEEDVDQALINAQSGDNQRRRLLPNTEIAFKNSYMPIETALGNRDDLVHLLISLGADVNGVTKSSRERWGNYKDAYLDYARFGRKLALQDTDGSSAAPTPSATSADDGSWRAYLADLVFDLQRRTPSSVLGRPNAGLVAPTGPSVSRTQWQAEDTSDFFADVEKALKDVGAKSWDELFPYNPRDNNAAVASYDNKDDSEKDRYYQLTSYYYSQVPVARILSGLYDELYEACYKGDNDKIQELCLPAEGVQVEEKNLLSMSVTTVDTSRATPLYAAVCGRHWNTVQLVFSIVGAQYQPEHREERYRSNVDNYDSDDDSEGCESDDTVEEDQPIFNDIASRPSKIKSSVSQQVFLQDKQITLRDSSSDGNITLNILHHTIRANDLEAFRHVLKLYKSAKDGSIMLNQDTLQMLLHYDRPDMLDLFIRQSGLGLSEPSQHEEGHDEVALNDKTRMYLGLNVHGKKRGDLAAKGDPNAVAVDDDGVPIVWNAAKAGATSVVKYLSGDKPFAAYKQYSISHNDTRALRIRRSKNFEAVLPEWLGWKVNVLGESPYTAAVLGGKLETIKTIFALKAGNIPKTVVHNRIMFLGCNLLTIAVQLKLGLDVVDFLLGRGLDPTICDQNKGYNLYHFACSVNHYKLLEHLLKKLPRDMSEGFLIQQSKTRKNTPLHIAARLGRSYLVKLLLDFNDRALDVADIDGSTPLHIAVRQGYAGIVASLVEHRPELTQRENGVGNTALEMAATTLLQKTLTSHPTESKPFDLHGVVYTNIARFRGEGEEGRLKGMMTDERVGKREELVRKVEKFLARPVHLKAPYQEPNQDVEEGEKIDATDIAAVYRILQNVTLTLRGLIHLIDVQRSVQGDLAKFEGVGSQAGRLHGVNGGDDVLDDELSADDQARKASLTYKAFGGQPETY